MNNRLHDDVADKEAVEKKAGRMPKNYGFNKNARGDLDRAKAAQQQGRIDAWEVTNQERQQIIHDVDPKIRAILKQYGAADGYPGKIEDTPATWKPVIGEQDITEVTDTRWSIVNSNTFRGRVAVVAVILQFDGKNASFVVRWDKELSASQENADRLLLVLHEETGLDAKRGNLL